MNVHSAILIRLKFALVLSACSIVVLAVSSFSNGAMAARLPTIKIVSGSDQRTTYLATFPKPLQVSATDPVTRKGIANVRIHFKPAFDNAAGVGPAVQLSAESAVTDEAGLASVTAVGLAVGTSSVEADLVGSPHGHVVFDGLRTGKAILTVVPANRNSTVGVIPALTEYTLSGLVNGETVDSAHITGTPLLTTVATSRSRDANYAIKGWPGTLTSPNYTFVPGFGTLVLSGAQTAGASDFEYNWNSAAADGLIETGADPEAVRPALLKVSRVSDLSSSDSAPMLVRTAVDPAKASYAGGQIAPSVSSIRAAVQQRGSEDSDHAKRSAIVRSTALQAALSGPRSSIKLEVAPAGLKAPGSN